MKNTSAHRAVLRTAQIAMLSAIVMVIQLFFASVRVGPVTIAFTLVPIVLAGTCIDPIAGLIVGLVSGALTFVQVFTSADPFYVFLMTNNPVATALICVVKTSAAGFLAGLVYRALKKSTVGSLLASIVCPIVNTGIFCLGMLIFFTNAFQADATFGAMSENIIYFVFIVLAGINFVFELISTAVIAPIVHKALQSANVFK